METTSPLLHSWSGRLQLVGILSWRPPKWLISATLSRSPITSIYQKADAASSALPYLPPFSLMFNPSFVARKILTRLPNSQRDRKWRSPVYEFSQGNLQDPGQR